MTEEITPEWAPSGSGFELGTDGPRVIMVGVDGSDSSWRAAAYAAGLARRQNALLTIVYVQPYMAMAGAYGADVQGVTQEVAEDLAREIHDHAERVKDVFQGRWKFLTRRGDAFTGLAEAADELKADMVVVGASEKTGHRLIGSVAVRLVKAGRWPVTVVP
ncbi:universal stress protein [Nocardia sp. CDC159]|uniref:Universal stress protein n=1 Tax=Nocardia pulmonis TaxID=2951408 RepID=A0A9X2E5S4_9NOCA|nr:MULTISPECIES: universal stress protein [Nocardia]MCM6772093.1 universal stress protein [Nocardia pulmonis]MCM6785249.1 universal stress protein [Nocardia sp. CDC159]